MCADELPAAGIHRRRLFSTVKINNAIHTAAHVLEKHIDQSDGSHGLNNHNCSRHDNRVVPPVYNKLCIFTVYVHGMLRLGNRRRRLDGCPHDDVKTVTQAAEDAAGVGGGFL